MKNFLTAFLIFMSFFSHIAQGESSDTTLILREIDALRQENRQEFRAIRQEITSVRQEIKTLRRETNQRFDLMQHYMDKRFEALTQIVLVLLAFVLGSPFIAYYLNRRHEKKYEKDIKEMKQLIAAIKIMAKDDPKFQQLLTLANLT